MSFDLEPHLDDLIQLRHKLHEMPEVSGSESETAAVIAEFIKRHQPDRLQTGVGGEGVLATWNGRKEGPHVLIRCELDALPINDDIEEDYCSRREGAGHKCGHDGHMSILCGVASLLGRQTPASGKVTLLFQPAEETGEGAARVLEDSIFKELKPDYCFALHNLPGARKHQVVLKQDVFAAASVGLKIQLKGKTAHAAHPEQGISPALAVAQLIQGLSALPQYKTPIEASAKLTVVHASLGEEAFGTSPGKATVAATLRTWQDTILEQLRQECLQLLEGTAETYGLNYDYEWVEHFPTTVNHPEAVAVVQSAAGSLGIETKKAEHPFGWSEDFGRITHQYRGALFGLGAGEDHPALHAENYDFPDEIISTGVKMFMKIITEVTEH